MAQAIFVKCSLFATSAASIGLLSLGVASPSRAAIVNGGFESNSFSGWTTIGNTSIQTAAFGSGPTAGNYEALVRNGSGAVSTPDLETFLGTTIGSLDDLNNGITDSGAAIKQTFTADAGNVLSFDWNFLTNEIPPTPLNDYAFISVGSLSTLTSVITANLVPFSSSFPQQTGFKTYSVTIPTTGTYTLALGVANVSDSGGESALLVDNVRLQAVPEPSSLLGILAFSTLGVLTLVKRRA